MIPEIGHFALILALCMALLLGSVPMLGIAMRIPAWVRLARPAAYLKLFCMVLAFACLTDSFIEHDFSVAYVAQNSNTRLPLLYRISGVWGAHEGSLLLWALCLSVWTGLVAGFSRSMPLYTRARVLAVMGWIAVGFLLFLLLTSNPFLRLFPSPSEGRDLNPLLQDPGLALHPPLLYMGYVGFSVAFAFAIASLLEGKLDAAWAKWSRPWTQLAWMFLTLGITLGSWWAYYELGWGGWWFWDPVENASFMPWLVGTALLHSLAVTEKRGLFKSWTVLLAIFAFSLSLLGTFLVRSGVLTSVHAFASDPARGIFILVFLAIVIGGSLLLYGIRAPGIITTSTFAPLSRETLLLVNNALLVVTAASILLGTLYPLLIDALGLGKLSVGPPYFNAIFVPLTMPLLFAVGFGVLLRWKNDSLARLRQHWLWMSVLAVLLGSALPLCMPHYSPAVALALALACWTLFTTLLAWRQRLPVWNAQRWRQIPAGFYGMSCAHLGIAVFAVGVAMTSHYSLERDVRLAPGESVTINGYDFNFLGIKTLQIDNYQADQAGVRVSRDGQVVAELKPQKRNYAVQKMPMTEAAIDAGLTRDLFVALGEPLGDTGAWSFRIYVKAFVRWIWAGGLLMALGGLLAACDRRYRLTAKDIGRV